MAICFPNDGTKLPLSKRIRLTSSKAKRLHPRVGMSKYWGLLLGIHISRTNETQDLETFLSLKYTKLSDFQRDFIYIPLWL